MIDIELYEEKLSIEKVIKSAENVLSQAAVLICDLSDIIQKYKIWQLQLPQVTPFYAVKCNDDLTIIKVLNQLGCGYDCASQSEIFKVKSLGVSADRIIFALPCKQTAHIDFARDNGVYKMTFDSEEELLKIKNHFPMASLLLRFRCDALKCLTRLGEKFGCDVEFEAKELLQKAKDLNLNVVGIAFHVGSGCQEYTVFERALNSAAMLMKAGNEIGFNMSLLDIGGGFPGDSIPKFIAISEIINKNLKIYFPNDNKIKIIAEPGRYFVGSAQTLITDIHSKRIVRRNNKIVKVNYYITDGAFGSLAYVNFDHNELIIELYEKNKESEWNKIDIKNKNTLKSTIWGPTCDVHDQIIDEIDLPNLQIGTKFVVKNNGAYAVCLASGFNGISLPKLKYFMSTKDRKIFETNFVKNYCINFRNEDN